MRVVPEGVGLVAAVTEGTLRRKAGAGRLLGLEVVAEVARAVVPCSLQRTNHPELERRSEFCDC